MASIDPAAVRAEFQKLCDNQALTLAQATRLAEEAARACLTAPRALEEGALLLCELATLPDPELAGAGVDGIFRNVIESMGDAFEARLCDLYIKFFAQVLEYCRTLSSAGWLDHRLRHFGLLTEEDLICRAERVRGVSRLPAQEDPEKIRKILVLSRVTLGADVAITSVVLRKMMQAFPRAQVALLAGPKAALLFAGENSVVVCPVEYPRGGSLIDRLAAWPAVVDTVQEQIEGLQPGEYVVVDPDSRLTQLGMLPVVADESRYHFFGSRSFSRPGLETLAELTAAWLEEVFGPADRQECLFYPWVSLPPEAKAFARAVRAALPAGRWASVNLGVGENPRKRIEGAFEQRLLSELLGAGWRIFLDKGEGGEETARVKHLLSRLREARRKVQEIDEEGAGKSTYFAGAPDVVAWRGSLAGFGALIGVSDLYIGYDSACQHIAAALGVSTVDIFAGFRSPRMVQRWRPSGPGKVSMIVVDRKTGIPACPPPERILAAVLEAAR